MLLNWLNSKWIIIFRTKTFRINYCGVYVSAPYGLNNLPNTIQQPGIRTYLIKFYLGFDMSAENCSVLPHR